MRLVLALLVAVGCGGQAVHPSPRIVSAEAAGPGAGSALRQVKRLPCRPVRVLGDPPPFVIGGTRAHDISHGWMTTLGNGDGVLVSEDALENLELSWWTGGTSRWRTPLARWGTGPLAAGDERVWVRTFVDTDDGHEVWSEIDGDGRVHRALQSPPYVHGLLPGRGGALLVLTGAIGTQTIWRVDRKREVAKVPLPEAVWSFAIAPAGSGGAAVLTTTTDVNIYPGRFDPRLVVPGSFDVAVGTGPTGHGALSPLPDGDWLIALGPRMQQQTVTAVKIGPEDAIRWRTVSGPLGDVGVVGVEPSGVIDVSVRAPDSAWQPRRLLVDLQTGEMRLADTARGDRWAVGSVNQLDNSVEGVHIPLDMCTRRPHRRPILRARPRGGKHEVASPDRWRPCRLLGCAPGIEVGLLLRRGEVRSPHAIEPR